MANGQLSLFPNNFDTFVEHMEIGSSDISDIQTLETLQLVVNKTPEQITQYNNLLTQYRNKIFLSMDLNTLQDVCYNLEHFTYNTFLNYYKYCGTYSNSTTYNIFNSVSFNGNTYMSLKQQTGVQPSNDGVNWIQNSSKGDTGERGLQGLPGVGMVPRGSYDDTVQYHIDDAVSYQGRLYWCKQDVQGVIPTNTTYWGLLVDKGSTTIGVFLPNIVTLSVDATNVVIGISSFNQYTDSLMVFKQGVLLNPTIDYRINTNGTSIDKTDSTPWTSGTMFSFWVLKNVASDVTYADGGLIQNGTIVLSKLNQVIQDQINMIGTDTLETTAQTLSGGINENKNKIDVLNEDLDNYESDLASQDSNKGASLIGIHDTNSQFTSTNVEGALNELVARPQKDVDNGRYQADFGLEDAVLSGCDIINNNIVKLGYSELSVVKQEHEDASTYVWNSYYVSQTIVSNGIDFDAVEYVELLVNKLNSPPGTLKVDLYDEMSKTTLATATVKDITSSESWCRATFESPVKITKGHDLVIRVYDGVSNSSTNSYRVYYSTTDVFENGFSNYSENGFTSNGALGKDLAFRLGVYHNATTGTATKTYAPTDIDKWGNVKVTVANINANNSATVTVKSSADVQLKSPVTLVNGDNYIDISSINSSTYPSLKVVITLNRNSVSDASPTISNVSVTWEGKGGFAKVTNGTWSDTSTTISSGQTITKTIPIEINAVKGKLIMKTRNQYDANSNYIFGAYVEFTTNPNDTICISIGNNTVVHKGTQGTPSGTSNNGLQLSYGSLIGNYTDLKNVYISGTNLILEFYCYVNSDTLNIKSLMWEVWA